MFGIIKIDSVHLEFFDFISGFNSPTVIIPKMQIHIDIYVSISLELLHLFIVEA
jgi:hypothetical protein